MRKFIKKQILDIFKTLYEAHDSVKSYIEKKENDNAISVLGECQNTAVQIGDIIDSSEGEGTPVIHLLEEYCEVVYNVSVGLNDDISGTKARKKLDKSLLKAETGVKNDIPVRLEIVFMPYKASMWDSLESVWKAADEDPDCDAYVVPIPYYDRNPDHSFGKYHYEGGMYPEYVPIVHYDNYDLEARRPDVIYIHNPYDANNYVTSVEPYYYSNALKQCSDCLVYIPYYSTWGNVPDNHLNLPAYYNVDFIMVQSEKMKKHLSQTVEEKKIIPLGTPKFDRIIRSTDISGFIPPNWFWKAKGKRVIFFNTSISDLLADIDCFMAKIKYVLEICRNNNDICLLWRPHPLLESTIKSMRGDYFEQYESLKREFKESGLGIFDETKDITYSVLFSDAYIGDGGSSVVHLFGVSGKPIFILNNVITSKPNKDDWIGERFTYGFTLCSDDRYRILTGDQLYYSNNNDYNYTFKCYLSEMSCGNMYCNPINVLDKVFICPINADDIIEIDNNGQLHRTRLVHRTDFSRFFYMIACGNYLFLFPNHYPFLVRYDINTHDVKNIEVPIQLIVAEKDGMRVAGPTINFRNKIFTFSPLTNIVICIDAETCDIKIVKIKTNNVAGFMQAILNGTEIWLVPFEGDIVTRWELETNSFTDYNCNVPGLKCSHLNRKLHGIVRPFSFPAFCDNNVFFPPFWGNKFVKLNINTGEVEEWIPHFCIPDVYKTGYYFAYSKAWFVRRVNEDANNYLLYSAFDRKLYKVNLKNDTFIEIPISFDEEEIIAHERGFSSICESLPYACIENSINTLESFLDDRIVGSVFDKSEQFRKYATVAENLDGTCGEKIHNFITGHLYDR